MEEAVFIQQIIVDSWELAKAVAIMGLPVALVFGIVEKAFRFMISLAFGEEKIRI